MSKQFDNSAAAYTVDEHANNRPRRACILRFDVFPSDARIENQAQALIDEGYSVDLVCMRSDDAPLKSVVNNIRVFRIPTLERNRGNIILYAIEYAIFCISVFFVLSFLQLRYRYHVIHVCNLPDFLVFAAFLPKLFGAKIILDFRELMVEMYAAKSGISVNSARLWPLRALERACIAFADMGLTCTEQMKGGLVSRGASAEKIAIMLNSVDPLKFSTTVFPDPAAAIGSRFNIITHGSVIPRYGHKHLIRAMALIRDKAPEARLLILGDGQERAALEALSSTLAVDDIVEFTGWISVPAMMSYLKAADVGAVTMIRNAETDLIHTIKMFEYMELGLPVILSRTTAVEWYFDDSMVHFVDAGNPEDLAEGLLYLRNNPMQRLTYAQNAHKQSAHYNTEQQKQSYATLVNKLVDGNTDALGDNQPYDNALEQVSLRGRSD